MRSLVENFSNQLEEALEIGKAAKFQETPETKKPIANVLISGMGGSGIGGTIVSELVAQKSKVPVYVSKSYFLPEYVNENTLVIISSYSGNTEETVQALETAIEKGALVACISSGGKILELATGKNIDHITIPGGMPPRAALGYSLVQMFFVLEHFNIINNAFIDDFKKAIALIRSERASIETEAKRMAPLFVKKVAVIYAPVWFEGVGTRFRQELNENAKMLGWSNVIPEMNHNEVLGWSEKNDQLAVLFFRNDTDSPHVQKRIDLTKQVVLKYTDNVAEVYSKGNSFIEKVIYLIHMGDWISLIVAELKEIDPDEIKVIDDFKSSLAKS